MASGRERPRVGDYLALGALAAGGLAIEIFLLRIFSFTQWHHFASLAVSLALLGFGAGATLLVALGDRARRWGDHLFIAGVGMAGTGMLGVYVLNQTLSVQPLFIVWDLREFGKLLLLNFAAFVPFLGVGISLGQVFVRWPESSKRLYAANLIGSGVGSLGAAALLATFTLETGWMVISGAIVLTGCCYGLTGPNASADEATPVRHRSVAGGLACGVVLLALLARLGTAPLPILHVSDFKRLSYLLDLPDAQVLHRSYGLRGAVTQIRSDSIRIAPGLSLRWERPVPPQDALVLDTDRVIPLPRQVTDPDSAGNYFQATLGALPYHLRPRASVLVLGTSEQLGALQAEVHQPGPITWIESNPQIVDALRRPMPFEGLQLDDPRRFLEATRHTFDVIVFDRASETGDSLAEDSLITVQGLQAALARLRPGGLVVIPLPLYNPPRYLPKTMRMVRDALDDRGLAPPDRHVLALRSMQQAMVCVSNRPFSSTDLGIARDFCRQWDFDLVWLPGLAPEDANRFHQVQEPSYYEAARATLTGEGAIPRSAQLYSVRSATDSRPYFWSSLRWKMLPQAWHLLGRQGLMLLDWGMLVLVVSIIIAAVLGALLILLPLGWLPKRSGGRLTRSRVLVYFGALGLAYLLLEMAAFQRCSVLLGHPVLAATVVFTTFLLGSGLGSASAPAKAGGGSVCVLFLPLSLGLMLAGLILWPGGNLLWQAPLALRVCAVAAALLPLTWAMGRPLPWGLHCLHRGLGPPSQPSALGESPSPENKSDRSLIPWAWGINAYASVVAAPLATLLSVEFGQPVTALAAVAFYFIAAVTLQTPTGRNGSSEGSPC